MRPKEEKHIENLHVSTWELIKSFKKGKSTATLMQEPGKESQAALYSIVREGKEFAGIVIWSRMPLLDLLMAKFYLGLGFWGHIFIFEGSSRGWQKICMAIYRQFGYI